MSEELAVRQSIDWLTHRMRDAAKAGLELVVIT